MNSRRQLALNFNTFFNSLRYAAASNESLEDLEIMHRFLHSSNYDVMGIWIRGRKPNNWKNEVVVRGLVEGAREVGCTVYRDFVLWRDEAALQYFKAPQDKLVLTEAEPSRPHYTFLLKVIKAALLMDGMQLKLDCIVQKKLIAGDDAVEEDKEDSAASVDGEDEEEEEEVIGKEVEEEEEEVSDKGDGDEEEEVQKKDSGSGLDSGSDSDSDSKEQEPSSSGSGGEEAASEEEEDVAVGVMQPKDWEIHQMLNVRVYTEREVDEQGKAKKRNTVKRTTSKKCSFGKHCRNKYFNIKTPRANAMCSKCKVPLHTWCFEAWHIANKLQKKNK